jgi:cobalt-zinc-cadmium efflux system membrane fusion protein
VKSPIAGIVADQLVTAGQTVDAASKLFTVMDLSQLWVTGALHDRDVAAVRPGVSAVVRIEGLADGGANRAFKGRVVQIGPQVDEKTRTLPVRVAIQNVALPRGGDTYALRPGMFARVDLETARKPDVLVVPLAAIQSIDGKPVVFVETPLTDGAAAFVRRPVVLGARDADVAEVTDGLRAGERVVVANAFLLKSEFDRAKLSHGDAH